MSRDTIRILILEPSIIVAEGISNILEHSLEFSVTGIMTSISQNVPARKTYDMVLVNPMLLCGHSVDSFRNSLSVENDFPVAAMLYIPLADVQKRSFDCCIELMDPPDTILKKLSEASHSYVENESENHADLSEREKDVLVAVAKGMTNKEIASVLNIAVNTVITHRRNISKKLGINSISGLTVYAILKNLVDISQIPV